MSKHSHVRKPLLRRTGVPGLAHSGAFGGSGAPSSGTTGEARTSSLKLLALAVAVTAAFLALSVAPAFAARGHEYLGETIGEPCPALEVPCGAGKLKEPSGVAVNEATHDIYVVDQGNHRVQVFDPAGSFVLMIGGEVNNSAVEEREAQEAASEPVTVTPAEENLCTAASGDECQPGSAGAGPGQFEEIFGIAVDNSCVLQGFAEPKCAEEDPSNGDLYVLDNGNIRLQKFSPAGAFINALDLSAFTSGNRQLRGVAVDPNGIVSVLNEGSNVVSYSNAVANEPTGPPRRPNPFEIEGFSQVPNSLAADASGHFYIGHITFTDNEFAEVSTAPNPIASELFITVNPALDKENSSALGVEQTTDVAFLDTITSVVAFNPEGTELERFGFEGDLEAGAGIGVDAASGFAYVADAAKGHLLVLAPTQPGPPSVEANQFVSGVTATEAELHSEVNPQSEAGEEPTSYSFEYGPCVTPTSCAISPFAFSTPIATLPPDFLVHPISAALSGLQPGTAYHYRVHAANEHGPTSGPEGIFTTQTTGPLALPDSRQWQLVSPPAKLGARIEPLAANGLIEAAADGHAFTYFTSTPTSIEPQGYALDVQVLSNRGTASWASRDIAASHSAATGNNAGAGYAEYAFFDRGLNHSVIQPRGPFDPELSPEASEQTPYLHDLDPSCAVACFRPLLTAKPGFANVPGSAHFGEDELCEPTPSRTAQVNCGPEAVGATEDLAHVFFFSYAGLELTPAEPPGLYEWTSGQIARVSVLPDGQPAGGKPGNESSARNAISTDGSRIAWTNSVGVQASLYLRDMARGETIQLDAAKEGCGSCESGAGVFQIASTDGSRVFFTDTNRLTEDSGAKPNPSGKADLYECRIVVNEEGKLACDLTDLTPANGAEAADVQGGVLGASADGSSLYFVARGDLDGAGPATLGDCKAIGTGGSCNLYRVNEGAISFITTLSGADRHDWDGTLLFQPTRVSSDGRWLELMSQRSLTGYDNRDAATGRPVAEVYLYDAASERILCASCDPTGARPRGVAYRSNVTLASGIGVWEENALVAANVPTWATLGNPGQRYQYRYLSDSGRLFFNSANALVPQDSNSTQDVYQYEPPGVGGCTTSRPTFGQASGGCVDLISAGTSGTESAFLDASENGDDVFFLTASQLVPQDEDTALDVYDAHSCPAGAAVPCLPSPPPPAPACEGDACQQPATPPNDQTPGSLTFNGAGNLRQCPKGKVKKSGKCAKKHKARKHHKKNAKKSHKRAANTNRRASR